VRATDRAGNRGVEASQAWTVDTAAPDTTIDSAPSDLSSDSSPSFAFSASEAASFDCKLDAGPFEACSSGQTYADVPDGAHTFSVQATDGAGNQEAEPAVHSWTVDTVAPLATITAGPPALTSSASSRFEFGASEAADFQCRLDGGEWDACGSPQAYTDLPDGEHTFEVRGTDKAGNEGAAATWVWTSDTTAPEPTIESGPEDPSNDGSPSFEFSAGEAASFECRLDEGAWTGCSSPLGYTDLTDGRHTFEVQATDAAGNRGGAAAYTWTVDTLAPEATIDSGPADPSNERTASFTFSASDAADFECKLDGGDWTACTSPQGYAGLADGAHTFQVRATDAAGNQGGAASHTWTIDTAVPDTTAPDTTITGGPATPSNSTSASLRFTGSDDETPPSELAFECRLDSQAAADFAACSSPKLYSSLSEGSHAFQVRAIDLAGNADQTPATYSWTVDSVAPETTIDSGPAALTNDSTPTFAFSSEAGATFQCRVDTVGFAACSSPHTTAALADGPHTFEVRATDTAGNTDDGPASRAITVDTTAPQTTITSAPPLTTTSTSASFGFTASEPGSTFECSLDDAAFTACTSPRDYTGLQVGAHRFSVRSRDAAGNSDASPAVHQWTISAPPQGCGSPVTAPAAADAWIDENSPANNKGSDSILKVQSKGPRDNFRALVRFSLPAVPQGCAVESATLRLYAASARTGRTLEALRLSAPWSENQVSWTNQPLPVGATATTTSGQGYREWSVTAHVQAMYAGANHGFLIRDAVEGQDAEQQFHSREKNQSPPQLVVRFTAAGG
jgi:Bacterial Ig-like domain